MANQTIEQLKKGIVSQESGGDYGALGKVIPAGSYAGDRAYGKYQVMGNNIPSWTKEALGTSYSKEDFLKNPDIQEKLADYKIGQLYNKYKNPADVASAWFTGGPLKGNENKKDVTGTTTSKYVSGVLKNMNNSQPETGKKSILQFGQDIQKQYPEYAQKDSTQLGIDVLKKYPEYQSKVDYTPPKSGFESIQDNPTSEAPNPNTGFLGTNPNESLYGKVIDNSITRGIRGFSDFMTMGGASQLGDANSSLSEKAVGAGKTGLSIALLIGGGAAAKGVSKGVSSLLSKSKALTNPKLLSSLEELGVPLRQFLGYSKAEQQFLLKQAVKDAGALEPLYSRAIQELEPLVQKELGLAPTALRKAAGWTGRRVMGLAKTGVRAGLDVAGLTGVNRLLNSK